MTTVDLFTKPAGAVRSNARHAKVPGQSDVLWLRLAKQLDKRYGPFPVTVLCMAFAALMLTILVLIFAPVSFYLWTGLCVSVGILWGIAWMAKTE